MTRGRAARPVGKAAVSYWHYQTGSVAHSHVHLLSWRRSSGGRATRSSSGRTSSTLNTCSGGGTVLQGRAEISLQADDKRGSVKPAFKRTESMLRENDDNSSKTLRRLNRERNCRRARKQDLYSEADRKKWQMSSYSNRDTNDTTQRSKSFASLGVSNLSYQMTKNTHE